jgi:hypothetical protein
MWGRAIAVWLLVMAVEFVQGTLRWIFLRPHVGDFRSGQIGVFTGSVLFLAIVYFCAPWMKLRSGVDGLRVGLLWVGLTLAFELSFGHYLMQRSWESIGAEYNLLHSGLMPIGLAIFGMSPWMALRLRRVREGRRVTRNHRANEGRRGILPG